MKKKSHQRITKIKLDQILELLKKAEDTSVEDACTIEPATNQLTPYPDMDNLRTWTRDYLTKGLNKILINKLDDNGQTYMTTLIDGLPLFTKMSKTIGENIETSKPGLWLSNLIQPVSGSQAGSWLRSNLIHSDEDKYSLINSYVIGNYSNTFTQPALILSPLNQDNANDMCPRKTKFPFTTDFVYYNQHYSPCISSCINYVNQPDNNSYYTFPITYFEYKYGSYQTIAFPADPDMQTYTETDSTCLNYNFTNPGDNGTSYNATLYSMQAANSLQTPEPINSLSLKPNGTTGGSVSGTLTSFDDNGNKCETNINYIFRTVQAMFSTDYEYVTSDNSLDNTPTKPRKAWSKLAACCYYHYIEDNQGYFYLASGYYRFRYAATMVSGITCSGVEFTDSEGNTKIGFSSGNKGVNYHSHDSATCGQTHDSPSVTYGSGGGYCGAYLGRLDGYMLYDRADLSGQSGLNIYLHVKDLAAESRSKGIPFVNPDCTQPSFQVSVNTDATPKDFEKVYLIAENVSIDALGNIDTINEKIIKLT